MTTTLTDVITGPRLEGIAWIVLAFGLIAFIIAVARHQDHAEQLSRSYDAIERGLTPHPLRRRTDPPADPE